jgi:hypothetical protein
MISIWLKLALFLMSSGVLYKELVSDLLRRKTLIFASVLALTLVSWMYFAADFTYHFVSRDSEKVGFPRWVAREMGVDPGAQCRVAMRIRFLEAMLPPGTDCTQTLLNQQDNDAFEKAWTHTPEDLRAYIISCKACGHRREAEELIAEAEARDADQRQRNDDRLQYGQAVAIGTVDAAQHYLERCGICAFRNAAQSLIAQINRNERERRDNEAFAAAERDDTEKAYLTYISQCDLCRHVAAANFKMLSLRRTTSLVGKLLRPEDAARSQRKGRFVIYRQFAIDTRRQLMWRRCALGLRFEQDKCVGDANMYAFSSAAEAAGRFSEDGYSGWRVATASELRGLLDSSIGSITRHRPFVDEGIFPNSSSINGVRIPYIARESDSNLYQIVYFDRGEVSSFSGWISWMFRFSNYLIVRDMPESEPASEMR